MTHSISLLLDRMQQSQVLKRCDRSVRLHIQRSDVRTRVGARTARVAIDDRQFGYLVGDQPLCLELEPGTHTVTALFHAGSRFRNKRDQVSTQIQVQSGDVVEMVCGLRPEWREYSRSLLRRFLVYTIIGYIIALMGWILFPVLREATASLVIRLKIDGFLLSLLYFAVLSRSVTAAVLCLSWYVLVGSPLYVRETRVERALRARVGGPYFLCHRSAQPGGRPGRRG
jgi:preprotein translocase subunit Sss1